MRSYVLNYFCKIHCLKVMNYTPYLLGGGTSGDSILKSANDYKRPFKWKT